MATIIKLVTLILLVEIIGFIIISSIPVNDPIAAKQAEELLNEASSQPGYFNLVSLIFTNNLLVTSVSFIPILGIGFLGYAIYNTGYSLSALSTSENLPGFLVAILLFIAPHSVVEFLSYAISAAAGILLIWKRKIKISLYLFGISILDLFIAALIESAILYNPSLLFVLWLPTIGFIALIFILLSRIEKMLQQEVDKGNIPFPPPPYPTYP